MHLWAGRQPSGVWSGHSGVVASVGRSHTTSPQARTSPGPGVPHPHTGKPQGSRDWTGQQCRYVCWGRGHTSPGQSAFQRRESLCLPSSAHLKGSQPAHPTPDLPQPSFTFTCSTQLHFLPLLLFRLLQPHLSLSLPSTLPPGGPTHQPHPWAPAPASAEVRPPQEGVDCAGLPGRAQQRRATLQPGWLFRELPRHCPEAGNPPQLRASPS